MKMHRFAIAAMTTLLAFATATTAFADNHDRRDGRGYYSYNDGNRGGYRNDRYNDNRRYYGSQGYGGYSYVPPPPPRVTYYRAYPYQRGYSYNNYYRGPIYPVNDYGYYSVPPPPYGHRWVRDDRGNLLLIAITTGIIADLILNH